MKTIVPEQYPIIAEIIRRQEAGTEPAFDYSFDRADLIAEIRNLLAVRQGMVDLIATLKNMQAKL